MKKIAIMLATIIFIQLGATSVFADYTDVSGHWALRFINELTDKKIVEGFTARKMCSELYPTLYYDETAHLVLTKSIQQPDLQIRNLKGKSTH